MVWNILGQTYKPVALSDSSFAFHTLFPVGTFVPPHIHPTQDEFIHVLSGQFELMLDGQSAQANAGDLVHLPIGLPHGIWNRTQGNVVALFWVSPSRGLYDLFTKLHNLTDPAEVVRLSATHEVDFLPPPG